MQLITLVSKVASRLPLSPRLAARDAARHGRRTGAAVAAAVIALGIPIAVATYSLSEETFERQSPRLGDDQLYFGTVDGGPAVEPESLVADVEAAFPDAVLVPLRNAVIPAKRPGGEPFVVFAFGARRRRRPTRCSAGTFLSGIRICSAPSMLRAEKEHLRRARLWCWAVSAPTRGPYV